MGRRKGEELVESILQIGRMVWVSVRRCLGVYVCARVLVWCVFDGLSHVGAQDTRFSGFFLRLGVCEGHLSASSRQHSVTLHRSIHAVVASPSSSSNGLHRTRRVEKGTLKTCRSCFIGLYSAMGTGTLEPAIRLLCSTAVSPVPISHFCIQ